MLMDALTCSARRQTPGEMRVVKRRKRPLAARNFVVSVATVLFGPTSCVSPLNPARYHERDRDHDAGDNTEPGKGGRSQHVQKKPGGGPAAGQTQEHPSFVFGIHG